MFKEAAADLAQVWLFLVELLFQAFQELPLESVDLFNVAKDGTKLLLSEHVCPLTALFDVTLRETEAYNTNKYIQTSIPHNTYTIIHTWWV